MPYSSDLAPAVWPGRRLNPGYTKATVREATGMVVSKRVALAAIALGILSTSSQCFPVQSFVTASAARASRGQHQQESSLLRAPLRQRTRQPFCPRSCGKLPLQATRIRASGSSDAWMSGSDAWGMLRGLMASLLCAAALLGGPDVTRVGDEVAWAAGLGVRPPAAQALSDEQDVLNDVWRVVNAAYVDPTFNGQDWKAVRMKALKKEYHGKDEAYAGAKEMLKALGDPYTRFLTPQEYDAVTGLARGGVAGVGLELAASPPTSSQRSSVIVGGVVSASPAEKAGVKSGDLLAAVDGEEALGTSLDAVAGMLRGDAGSTVRLDVKRDGKALSFPVTRAQFKYEGVRSEVKSEAGRKVGVVTIKVFSKDTVEDVRKALVSVVGDGAESILLDLRHNPGGFFPGGIDVARLFLPSDETIVSVVDRNGIADTYGTIATGKFSDLPLVLVVDSKTASASEILSAALKDNGRAKLAGQTTFGKAKVQTLNQIFDGSGVAVTISLYKTPSGADINGKGIPVDFPSECLYPGDALACVPPQALAR